jgi:hypothetical protein
MSFMDLPNSMRIHEELEQKVEESLESNSVKFSQLVNMALAKFISEHSEVNEGQC